MPAESVYTQRILCAKWRKKERAVGFGETSEFLILNLSWASQFGCLGYCHFCCVWTVIEREVLAGTAPASISISCSVVVVYVPQGASLFLLGSAKCGLALHRACRFGFLSSHEASFCGILSSRDCRLEKSRARTRLPRSAWW
jgi:hypothetical protein